MKLGDLVKEKKLSNMGLVIGITTGVVLVRWFEAGPLPLWISQERLEVVVNESR